MHLDKNKLLLVEDNLINRKVATIMLEEIGFDVDFAENGVEAIQNFLQNEYDFILMDIQMPEMDGLTATQEIRRLESVKGVDKVKIIALTANAMKEDIQNYLKSGFDGYILKPFVKEDFLEKLR